MYQTTTLYIFYPKQCNFVFLVMHNACDTPIQRYLRFMLWARICNERKERDPICLRINKNAQTTVRRWNGPTGRNRLGATQLNAADWLVRLRSVVLKPFADV